MTGAVDFSILAAIPSGPDALLCPRLPTIPLSLPQSTEAQEGIGKDVHASGQYLRYQVGVQID